LGNRDAFQRFGLKLEAETKGAWLANYVVTHHPDGGIVDAVRTADQAEAFKQLDPKNLLIHLTASKEVRWHRLAKSTDQIDRTATGSAEQLIEHPLEAGAEGPARLADIVLETSNQSIEQTFRAALDRIRSITE
jgi:hypothetical protein